MDALGGPITPIPITYLPGGRPGTLQVPSGSVSATVLRSSDSLPAHSVDITTNIIRPGRTSPGAATNVPRNGVFVTATDTSPPQLSTDATIGVPNKTPSPSSSCNVTSYFPGHAVHPESTVGIGARLPDSVRAGDADRHIGNAADCLMFNGPAIQQEPMPNDHPEKSRM